MDLRKINGFWQNLNTADLDGEEWKVMCGYEEADGVWCSNMGRVKVGNFRNINKTRILILQTNQSGYPTAQIQRGGERRTFTVHRKVAQLFIPNPLGLPEVNHIRGIKWDNRATELEWTTRSDNLIHAARVLGHFSGVRSGRSKLTKEDVLNIFYERATHREIALKYNIGHNVVGNIKRRRSYLGIVGELPPQPEKSSGKRSRLLDREVLAIYNSKLKRKEVCATFKIPKWTYHGIKSGKNFKNVINKQTNGVDGN